MPGWFDTFTDAIAAGDAEYVSCNVCEETLLPPRRLCPACGSAELTRQPLSDRGAVLSYTEISVTIPKFHGETPYTVVLVELASGVNLTGQLRDATPDEISIGDEVVLGTEQREDGIPLLTFRPDRD